MIDELEGLQDKFYHLLNNLKEAKACFTGLDEGYALFAQNILEQYKLEYELLDLKGRVGTEQAIDKLKARYYRLVPQRWETRFLHRKKQNYAATLIDIEANEDAAKFFAEVEAHIAAEVDRRLAEDQAVAEAVAEPEEWIIEPIEAEDEETPDLELMDYSEGEEGAVAETEPEEGDTPPTEPLSGDQTPNEPAEQKEGEPVSEAEEEAEEEARIMQEFKRKKKKSKQK